MSRATYYLNLRNMVNYFSIYGMFQFPVTVTQ